MRSRKSPVLATRVSPSFAVAIVLAASASACSREPQTAYDVEPAYSAITVPEGQTVYVYVGAPPEAALPAPPAPRAAENPFEVTRTWVGEYDCPQGTTAMRLRVVGVRGLHVDAVFEFHHVDSGAAGRYEIAGRYDPGARTMTFSPGAWIERPPRYVTVGMRGDVSGDGTLFAGRITHPSCGMFSLHPAR